MHENIKPNTKYSLHTHTDDKGSRCYLVSFDSNGAFDDALCVDDPIVLEGKVTITSDKKGRKIIEVIDNQNNGTETHSDRDNTDDNI